MENNLQRCFKMINCICDEITLLRTFKEPDDYDEFKRRFAASPLSAHEVPVESPLSDYGDPEKWYQCPKCGRKWRLIPPEYPGTGVWGPVRAIDSK
jgi:hypothetical protein